VNQDTQRLIFIYYNFVAGFKVFDTETSVEA